MEGFIPQIKTFEVSIFRVFFSFIFTLSFILKLFHVVQPLR